MLAGTSGGASGWAAVRLMPEWISLDSAEKISLTGIPRGPHGADHAGFPRHRPRGAGRGLDGARCSPLGARRSPDGARRPRMLQYIL